jgi:5-methylthioadenosine/S-adenosylhomocysteine deaminase
MRLLNMGSEDRTGQRVKASKKQADLVIEGGMVITMAEGQAPVLNGRVFIKDGIITDIQSRKGKDEWPGIRAEVIDAKDAIVMPGLVNAHTHAAMTLFRGLADDLPLKQWLFEKIFPAEAKFLNPDTVYWGSLLGCLEMIASGTTCISDGYFFQDETVRAVHESGLRGLIAQGVIDFPAPGAPDPKKNLKSARGFIERWLGFSALITPGIFCHSPVTCSEETLKGAWEISRSFDLPLQIHLSETSDEVNEVIRNTGERPVFYLDRLGLIDKSLIAAHAIHLDEREISRIFEKGVKIVHVPESNMKLCAGLAPVRDMVNAGLKVGLGTDGCSSNNNLDLFCEMDTAAKLSKVYDLDPVGLDANTVIKMATCWGASVLGLEKEIGTLEIGKRADIIVVDTHQPHLCPVYDALSAIVYSANGADVKDVIVNGKVLMKNRAFTTLDPVEIMEKVKTISSNIRI